MEAKELRIGNYIDYEKTTHIIQSLEAYSCVSNWIGENEMPSPYDHYYEEIDGIKLTQLLLLKLGFEKIGINYRKIDNKGFEFCLWKKWDSDTFGIRVFTFIKNIEYVHQLQNLYFALTGEELKLNP